MQGQQPGVWGRARIPEARRRPYVRAGMLGAIAELDCFQTQTCIAACPRRERLAGWWPVPRCCLPVNRANVRTGLLPWPRILFGRGGQIVCNP